MHEQRVQLPCSKARGMSIGMMRGGPLCMVVGMMCKGMVPPLHADGWGSVVLMVEK